MIWGLLLLVVLVWWLGLGLLLAALLKPAVDFAWGRAHTAWCAVLWPLVLLQPDRRRQLYGAPSPSDSPHQLLRSSGASLPSGRRPMDVAGPSRGGRGRGAA